MTHHTSAVLTRVTRRDPSSVRVVVPVHATPWHINAHGLHSVQNLVDAGTLNDQVYLGRLDSSYWVEEQLGLNMGRCKVPCRSERGPPAEARKHGQCRRRVQKKDVAADLLHMSTRHRDSQLTSTWCRAHDGHQNEHSLQKKGTLSIQPCLKHCRIQMISENFPNYDDCVRRFFPSSSPLHLWQQSPGTLSFNVQSNEGQGRGRHSFIPP